MEWTIPGTVLTGQRENPEATVEQLRAMFLAGGIVGSQVAAITGLEPHAIQNWVKRGFLSPPQAKRYTLRQLCRIMTINMLRNALPMEKICSLLSYINGRLDDESDDSISDTQLYFAFVTVAARYTGMVEDEQAMMRCIRQSLPDYQEPFPGARERGEKVLAVMLMAWTAGYLRQMADKRFDQLNLM